MITALLTRCKDCAPLVVLEGRPFNGLEIRPADLRAMAQKLIAIADMAMNLPTGGKHWKPTTVTLGAAVPEQAVISGAQIEESRIARKQAQLDRAAFGRLVYQCFAPDADAACAGDLLADKVKTVADGVVKQAKGSSHD